MAKTWSNRKVTEYISPAIRERNRPSSTSVFTVALIVICVFFIGLMTYVTIRAEQKPPTEYVQTQRQEPGDD